MVVSTRVVLPWVYPVRVSSAALVARSSTGPNGTGVSPTCWDPTRPRIRVSQRPNTIAARDRAAAGSRSAHPVPNGPNASGLIRAGRPGPTWKGATPREVHRLSYSSLGSPRIKERYPKSIIRRMNALVVADFPRPGLPKQMTLGLVTPTSSRRTQPIGSQ